MDVNVSIRSTAEALSRLDPHRNALVWLHVEPEEERPVLLRYRTANGYVREWRIEATDSRAHRAGNVGLNANALAHIARGGDIDAGWFRLRGEEPTRVLREGHPEGPNAISVEHLQDGRRYVLTTIRRDSPDPVEVPDGPPDWSGTAVDLRRALEEATARAGKLTWLKTEPDAMLRIEGRNANVCTVRTVQGEGDGIRWSRRISTAEARSCVAWLDGKQVRLWMDPSRLRIVLENDGGSRFELEAKYAPAPERTTEQTPLDRIECSSLTLWRLDRPAQEFETARWTVTGTRLYRGGSRIEVGREHKGPLQWICRAGELGNAASIRMAQKKRRTTLELYLDRIEVENLYTIETGVERGRPDDE